jgi:nicotinate-nucleotide adenylyltransferase
VGRLGVLGGTFNPPHRGHLALARHAMKELGLGRVLLMPARRSPGKPVEDDPGATHRLEMCRLAVEGVEGVDACALEIEQDGPSYTVDTLRTLHVANPNIEIAFILGADVARTLPSWREAHALPALARFVVALRPGTGPEAVRRALAPLSRVPDGAITHEPGPSRPIGFLNMPPIDVSSSLVRERLQSGEPIDELVGPAVASYVAAHRLYRLPTETGAR